MAKIVVVGDDATCIAIATAVIESILHEAVHVEDPLDVVEQIVATDARLVILDEHFAEFDAFQIAEMIRQDPEVPRELPIVLMACDTPNLRRLYQAGVTDYMLKESSSVMIQDMVLNYLGDEAGASDASEDDPVAFLNR